jgi:hypothetical protein
MTQDFIEDASDILAMSGQPYIIIFGVDDRTIVHSNMHLEDHKTLSLWVENGHFLQIMKDHLDNCQS